MRVNMKRFIFWSPARLIVVLIAAFLFYSGGPALLAHAALEHGHDHPETQQKAVGDHDHDSCRHDAPAEGPEAPASDDHCPLCDMLVGSTQTVVISGSLQPPPIDTCGDVVIHTQAVPTARPACDISGRGPPSLG